MIKALVKTRIPTSSFGQFYLYLYQYKNEQHLALVFGSDIDSSSLNLKVKGETEQDRLVRGACLELKNTVKVHENVLVRVHSSCFTGETLCSSRCDCSQQLYRAMEQMSKQERGVVIYLLQEGRGIGLAEKLKAYNLQDLGYDTVTANQYLNHPPDARDYSAAALILQDLGISSIRLMTNNPNKLKQLSYSVSVLDRVPMVPEHWSSSVPDNVNEMDVYLITKIQKMDHLIDLPYD